ncbi:hypothetical protein [Pedobacter psychrodurus]|uniref:hypothetical protein n=1 Tax=Pedobacter psychrodurus TaxID=2530456 RepID=UPI00292EFBEA|nr:hypothetical protein [Pedobacter psychrodurus]
MNSYHQDSGLFFQQVSKGIEEKLDKSELVQIAFNLALGCERLLKGILYDINPLYVLTEPSFKNSMQIGYADRLLPESKGSGELLKTPIQDVITYKNSLLRAQLVSKTVANHKNILFAISEARDIIAHCNLKELDVEKINDIIQRDFFTMLDFFAQELAIKPHHYFGGHHDKLFKISISKQTDLSKRIELILERHIKKWEQHKVLDGYVKKQQLQTKSILNSSDRATCKCPVCKQDAIIYLEPIIENKSYVNLNGIIGYEIVKIRCLFCKLNEDDPRIMDNWKLNLSRLTKPCTNCKTYFHFDGHAFCEDCRPDDRGQIGLF